MLRSVSGFFMSASCDGQRRQTNAKSDYGDPSQEVYRSFGSHVTVRAAVEEDRVS